MLNRQRYRWVQFFEDQRGASAIEYGLICALLVLVVAGAIAFLGNTNAGSWNDTGTSLIDGMKTFQ